MRSFRREFSTRGNLDGAEGGISYSLLSTVPRPSWFKFLKILEPHRWSTGRAEAVPNQKRFL